jgi:FAD binding domain
MAVPPGVSERNFQRALERFAAVVGEDWVFTSDADVALYRDAYSPLVGEQDEKVASAAIAPDSTDEVQAIVRIANEYRIPLYPISTGRNLGYGGAAPFSDPGCREGGGARSAGSRLPDARDVRDRRTLALLARNARPPRVLARDPDDGRGRDPVEYRTHTAFMDQCAAAYPFNDNALLRLHERLKDAIDPNGILSAGRYGIWPKHLREG